MKYNNNFEVMLRYDVIFMRGPIISAVNFGVIMHEMRIISLNMF